jgi:hypothetical protein
MQLDQSKIRHQANRRADFQPPVVGVLICRDAIGVAAVSPNHLLTAHTTNTQPYRHLAYSEYRQRRTKPAFVACCQDNGRLLQPTLGDNKSVPSRISIQRSASTDKVFGHGGGCIFPLGCHCLFSCASSPASPGSAGIRHDGTLTKHTTWPQFGTNERPHRLRVHNHVDPTLRQRWTPHDGRAKKPPLFL